MRNASDNFSFHIVLSRVCTLKLVFSSVISGLASAPRSLVRCVI